jgi:hypothetical protein
VAEYNRICELCRLSGVKPENVFGHYDVADLSLIPADKFAEVAIRLSDKISSRG